MRKQPPPPGGGGDAFCAPPSRRTTRGCTVGETAQTVDAFVLEGPEFLFSTA